MKSLRSIFVSVVIVTGSVISAPAQSGTPSQATTLVGQALTALANGTVVSDVTASGTAVWIVGGNQRSGTATLRVKGTNESRIDVTFGGTSRTEIRNDSNGPDGEWIGADGTPHHMAIHNCWVAPGLYSPYSLITSILSTNITLTYVGPEVQSGVAVDHIQGYIPATPNVPDSQVISHLSTFDIYLDQTSHLLWSVRFLKHPDNNANTDIPIEVRFANYQAVNGVLIPFHIQRLLNNELNIDVTVANAATNTGLTDSVFALQ